MGEVCIEGNNGVQLNSQPSYSRQGMQARTLGLGGRMSELPLQRVEDRELVASDG